MLTGAKKQFLVSGVLFARNDIAILFGGNKRTFLPQAEGVVVAGCFDPRMNPNALREVVVSNGRSATLAAKRLLDQKQSVPIFLRREANCWEYIGRFRAVRYTEDPDEVRSRIYEIIPRIYEKYRKSYGDIRGILFLDEA